MAAGERCRRHGPWQRLELRTIPNRAELPSMSYPLVRRSPWLTIAEQPVRGLPDPGGRQSSGLGQPAWTGEGPIRAATVTGALAPDDAAGSIRIFMRQFAYGGVADWSSLRAWVIWVRV